MKKTNPFECRCKPVVDETGKLTRIDKSPCGLHGGKEKPTPPSFDAALEKAWRRIKTLEPVLIADFNTIFRAGFDAAKGGE